MDNATSAFGEKLKEQVEERLRFYEEGVAPSKNVTAMQEAIATARAEVGDLADGDAAAEKPKKSKKKKRKTEDEEEVAPMETGELACRCCSPVTVPLMIFMGTNRLAWDRWYWCKSLNLDSMRGDKQG